jgi:acetate---CoA ligase (ADP-forming)
MEPIQRMTIDSTLRKALFEPRSVALVGASADLSKNNSRPQRFLKRFGFKGRVLPINPSRTEVLGERAYPDLRSAPGPIDHAFIMVPSKAVPEVIEQCCELRVPVATLFTAGFAELGAEGARRQRDMVRKARAAGLRLLGPNCMGVVNVHDRIPLSVNAVIEREELVAGPLSLISQSGSMTGSVLSRAQARGLGFSKLISVGNECDLGVGELAQMLAEDEHTGAILLFLETFRDADHLALAARRAFDAGKPVIAYKLGRSGVGRRVAHSHTGALTGPDEVANAFFREHGILRVDTFEGLFESAQFVMGHRPPRGKRVSVVTGTGGAAAMVVDRLGVLGCDVVGPSPDVIRRLAEQDIEVSEAPLTDIPMGRSEGGRYSGILSALLASDHTDAVVSVIGSSAQDPQIIVDRVLNAQSRNVKPLGVFLAPRADDALVQLQRSNVASFRTPESCADAVNAYLNWRSPGERPERPRGFKRVSELCARHAGSRLSEREAGVLFNALGIAVADHRVLTGGSNAIDLPGPFAVKLLSPDLLHKTDAGMVKLDVAHEALAGTVEAMLAEARTRFPDARIDGVLVQPMQRGLLEAIVGYRRDPEIGPVVLVGLGGIAAEVRKSTAVRVAPVAAETAQEMIEEIADFALLRGFRNLPRGDLDALATSVQAMSRLAQLEGRLVLEAEVNPLIVKRSGEGAVAVDGLVVFESEPLPPRERGLG